MAPGVARVKTMSLIKRPVAQSGLKDVRSVSREGGITGPGMASNCFPCKKEGLAVRPEIKMAKSPQRELFP